jgi:cytosine/uracil/thiamine/allantoin permease
MVEPPAIPMSQPPMSGRLIGKPRSPGKSVLLAIVTLGIYTYVWTFKTHKEMKDYSGNGLGGGIGFLIYFLLSPVTYFLIPGEIKNMLAAEGATSPVSAIWGLWFLLPLIGSFIWFFKMQGTLNDFWVSKGAAAP